MKSVLTGVLSAEHSRCQDVSLEVGRGLGKNVPITGSMAKGPVGCGAKSSQAEL